MREEIELDRLQISSFRPRAWPLPWPTPGEMVRARETGLIEPVVVRALPGAPPVNFEILSGLKNWLLAQRLGTRAVSVSIRDVTDDVARAWVAAEADDAKRDPIALARAIRQRVDRGSSVAAAGREFGLTRTDAAHRLRLLRLSPDVREQVARGVLAPGTARALVGLDCVKQRALADQILSERLTARQAEALAKSLKGALGARASSSSAPSSERDPDRARLERALCETLGTAVSVRYDSSGRGQVVIDFDTLDILDGILEKLGYISG